MTAGPDPTARADAAAHGRDDVEIGLGWIGHSTVLIELPGLTVLTDPLFRERLGPLRRHGHAPDPSTLPVPDVVLVSHAHPDHFDARSIRALPGDPLVLVPRGMGSGVRRSTGRQHVHEMALGERVRHGAWTVVAVRARHWRWPFSPAARAIGYLIEGPLGVYFAGDTAEFSGMRELVGRVDLALLPIGRWGPQPTTGHLDPEAAARVTELIRPRLVLPIHWGTFYPIGLERFVAAPLRDPARRFAAAVGRSGARTTVEPLEPGERTRVRLPVRSAAES